MHIQTEVILTPVIRFIHMISIFDRFLYVHIWDTHSNLVDATRINLTQDNPGSCKNERVSE